MTNKYRVLLFTTTLIFHKSLGAEQIIVDHLDPLLWRRVIVIPKDQFDESQLAARFRQIFQQDRGKAKIIRVETYVDANASKGNCKCVTDVSYSLWRDLYADYSRQVPVVAELIIIGNNAVMRVRDESGRTTKRVISGHDPTLLELRSGQFEVLFMSSNHSELYGNRLLIFARTTGGLSLAGAEDLARTLKSTVQYDNIRLQVRRDSWFITSDSFPIVYLFDSKLRPPTQEEYDASREAICFPHNGSFSCNIVPAIQ